MIVQLTALRSSEQPRPLNQAAVELIAGSMASVGLIQPITVVASKVAHGVMEDGFRIVAGHHRVAAARSLGWSSIEAIVIDSAAGHLRAELVEIDENLCRAELTTAQRTKAIKRRKQIWEAMRPEAAKAQRVADLDVALGGPTCPTQKASAHKDRPQNQAGFAADTAAATGESKRDINRHLARAEALGDDLDRVVGTSLDKGVELDALATLPPEQKRDLIDRAAAGERVSAQAADKRTEPSKAYRQTVSGEALCGIRSLSDPDLSAFLTHVEAAGIKAAIALFLRMKVAA